MIESIETKKENPEYSESEYTEEDIRHLASRLENGSWDTLRQEFANYSWHCYNVCVENSITETQIKFVSYK